jgi:hypothetical protein
MANAKIKKLVFGPNRFILNEAVGNFILKPGNQNAPAASRPFPSPMGLRPHAVRNNVFRKSTYGSKFAQIHPGQPQRTDSRGSDHPLCLLWGELEILGALPKPGIDLLRPAAAEPHGGRSFARVYRAWKPGKRGGYKFN